MQTTNIKLALLTLAFLSAVVHPRCMYDMLEDTEMPIHTDREPFQLGILQACKDFI